MIQLLEVGGVVVAGFCVIISVVLHLHRPRIPEFGGPGSTVHDRLSSSEAQLRERFATTDMSAEEFELELSKILGVAGPSLSELMAGSQSQADPSMYVAKQISEAKKQAALGSETAQRLVEDWAEMKRRSIVHKHSRAVRANWSCATDGHIFTDSGKCYMCGHSAPDDDWDDDGYLRVD
jgi:hypothetical protein